MSRQYSEQLDFWGAILSIDSVFEFYSNTSINHLYRNIARSGCTVVIPFREEMAKRHLKVTGDLGRIVFMVSLVLHFMKAQVSDQIRSMIYKMLHQLKKVCATRM